ncbi:MAG TPA: hypothetical protein VD963_11485 [Phycisphaerales bacterium]|nr:hypothetical protein [Phycisphaerales bacterium]
MTGRGGQLGFRCVGCGYLISGLDPGGDCPECGHPIAESLSPHWAHHSGRAYLRTVGLSGALMAIGAASALAVPVVAPAGLVVLTLLTVAALLATTPDPRTDWSGDAAWRTLGRALPLAALGACGLVAVAQAGGVGARALSLPLLAAAVVWLAGLGCATRHLLGIVAWIPHCQTGVLWGASSALFGLAAIMTATLAPLAPIARDLRPVLACTALPVFGLLPLALIPAGLLTVMAARRALRLLPDAPELAG